MAEKVSNEAVAKQFYLLALIMDIQGEKWRANTYRKAARRIEDLSSDLEEHWLNDELTLLEGVGESIAAKIGEYYQTGKIQVIEENRHLLPEDLELFNDIPGLTEQHLSVLIREGGVRSIEDLLIFLRYGKLSELPGFTLDIEGQIKGFLRWRREQSGEVPLPIVVRSAEAIIACLKSDRSIKEVELAGPVRRSATTVNNLTLLFQSDDPEMAIARFGMCPEVDELTVVEKESALGRLRSGVVCMLRRSDPDSIVIDRLVMTGSEKHIQQLRKTAKQEGYDLTSNGLFKEKQKIALKSEEDLYGTLGLSYFPPEMREGRIDISKPVEDLGMLQMERDYLGDFHVNSDFSNGISTISEIAFSAKGLGLQHICFLDRLGPLRGSMDLRASEDRNEKIDSIASTIEVQIIKGIEVDIEADGSLDGPDDVSERFDFVAGGVHSHLNMSRKEMTNRLIAAVESGTLDGLTHPTNRIIGYRNPVNFDLVEVAKAAKMNNVALEINSSPDRLDLGDDDISKILDIGALFYIGTDAHSARELDDWKWGAMITRRALLSPARLLNRLSPRDIRKRRWKKGAED